MNKIVEALKKTGVFFVATIDGEQSRVRPFSAVEDIDGKVCLVTNNQKNVFRQMMDKPNIEISGMNKDGTWLRVTGKAVRLGSGEIAARFLDMEPALKKMYSAGDGIVEVIELADAKGTLYSFSGEPKEI